MSKSSESAPSKPSDIPSTSNPKSDSQNHKTQANELLNVLTSAGNQKKSKRTVDGNSSDSDVMEIYRNAGKKAVALLDPFTMPTNAFLVGIQHDKGGQVDDKLELDSKVVQQWLHFYNGILKFVPSLWTELDTITPPQLTKIMQAITKGMSDGRSTDLALVKHKGLKYIPENMYNKSDILDPPIPEVEDKSMHGIFHPQLARFLCPRRDLEEFDEDPEVGMQALQAGDFLMKSSWWPAGFYQDDVYDLKDKTIGLFRNHVVVRFYKHLFLGPVAVTNDSTTCRAAKPSKNRAWGLDSVDRYIIAYVHIIICPPIPLYFSCFDTNHLLQTYITISHAQHWTPTIGDMDLQDLYWRIVEMLEDNSDPWVQETLKWWNKQCNPTNGSESSTSKEAKDDAASSEDDMAQVCAQRAAATSTVTKKKTPGSTKAIVEMTAEASRSIDISNSEAPSRNEPKEKKAALHVAHASLAKSKRTEHEIVAHKKSSMCNKEDINLPKARSTRNEPKEKEVPCALPAKLKRTEHEVVRHKKSSMHGQLLDKSKLYASASTTLINDLEDDGSDYNNYDVNTHSTQWDSNIGDAIQVDDDTADGHTGTQDSPGGSPLSQLPDDVDDETTLVNMQGARVGSNHAKHTIKFTFSAATKDNDDTAAPLPQKKAKKASTRPQTAPPKWNPARGKRANGF